MTNGYIYAQKRTIVYVVLSFLDTPYYTNFLNSSGHLVSGMQIMCMCEQLTRQQRTTDTTSKRTTDTRLFLGKFNFWQMFALEIISVKLVENLKFQKVDKNLNF